MKGAMNTKDSGSERDKAKMSPALETETIALTLFAERDSRPNYVSKPT